MTPAEELARALGAPEADVDGTRLLPMTCERAEGHALSRAGYLYELKLDGVRIVADRRGPRVRLGYRRLRDATASYGEIAEALLELVPGRFVIDGEIVTFDERGRPSFQRLAHRIQTRDAITRARVPVVYVVFDVLAVGHHDVRALPIEARREILARLVPDGHPVLRRHDAFDTGTELFRFCREHGLEGVVAKRRGSTYEAGQRSSDWLKIKCEHDAEFVVVGWKESESIRRKLGALEVASYEDGRLVHRGRVGSGLDDATIDLLTPRLRALATDRPAARGMPVAKRHLCRPELVVSVRYGGFTSDAAGKRVLRFPVFRGIRADMAPEDCDAGPESTRLEPAAAALLADVAGQECLVGEERRRVLTLADAPAGVTVRRRVPVAIGTDVEGAHVVRALASELGLAAVAFVGDAVEVRIALGGGDGRVAQLLAEVLAGIAARKRPGTRFEPLAWATAAFSPCAAGHHVPAPWDDLSPPRDVAARARAAAELMRPLEAAVFDEAALTRALAALAARHA